MQGARQDDIWLKEPVKIDSHQHFWRYDAREYPWIDAAKSALRRDFLPPDLAREQAPMGYDGAIVVQARQTTEETRWLLELAEKDPRIRGVVGWVDLQSAAVRESLGRFAAHPKFVGVRHVVQDEPDDRFLMRPGFLRGIEALAEFGLVYDLLIFPKQLPAAIELARHFPSQPFVLDHIAKPFIKDRLITPWQEQIFELAACPNVHCKVSGMVTEADWKGWQSADFAPYLDVVLEAFGPARLMVGSDWPVCLLAADYRMAIGLAEDYFARLSPAEQEKILGSNALAFYRRRVPWAGKFA